MDSATNSPPPPTKHDEYVIDTPMCDTFENDISHKLGDMSFPLAVSTTAHDIGRNKIASSFENGGELNRDLGPPIQFTRNTLQESHLTPELQRVQILDSASASVTQNPDPALVNIVANEMDIDQPMLTPSTPSPSAPVRPEWVGTSHVFYDQNIQLQKNVSSCPCLSVF